MSEAKRILLATKFPEQFIRDTIVPGLRAIGVEVTRIVDVAFEGQIRDVDAVAFMFQMCSHVAHDNFKARAKAAGVPFLLLTRQSVEWPRAFKMAGIDLPMRPINPTPLPTAETPKKNGVIVANGAPLIPPPAKAPETTVEPSPVTFGEALRAYRKRERVNQSVVAGLCGVDQSTISGWEGGAVVPEAQYRKLCELSPDIAAAIPPSFTARPGRPRSEPRPVVVPLKPVEKANGHDHRPRPLEGLRRAARALGMKGAITITLDDGASEVRVGEESWGSGPDADAAVETARKALAERLADLIRMATEARAELGGAA